MTDKEAFDLIATHAIPCAQADGGPRQAPRVMNEAPKWTAIDEAMRWLNEVETVQGGANGPTIKLRAAILAILAILEHGAQTGAGVEELRAITRR